MLGRLRRLDRRLDRTLGRGVKRGLSTLAEQPVCSLAAMATEDPVAFATITSSAEPAFPGTSWDAPLIVKKSNRDKSIA
jgi:hypothetical protein